MVILGIDPGFEGGLAFLTWDGVNLVDVKLFVMPVTINKKRKSYGRGLGRTIVKKRNINTFILNKLIVENKPDFTLIEKVSSRPHEGVVSSFNFGFGAGILEGIMVANNLSFGYVSPIKWTNYFAKFVPHSNPKVRSKMYIDKYYPHINFLATENSRVPHSGLVDAFMISLYCKLENIYMDKFLEFN